MVDTSWPTQSKEKLRRRRTAKGPGRAAPTALFIEAPHSLARRAGIGARRRVRARRACRSADTGRTGLALQVLLVLKLGTRRDFEAPLPTTPQRILAGSRTP